jgi:hypothetical protein
MKYEKVTSVEVMFDDGEEKRQISVGGADSDEVENGGKALFRNCRKHEGRLYLNSSLVQDRFLFCTCYGRSVPFLAFPRSLKYVVSYLFNISLRLRDVVIHERIILK